MFYFIFAANDLSGSHFYKKNHGYVNWQKTQYKRYKIKQTHTNQKRYKDVEDEILMQSLQQKFLMVLSNFSQDYISKTKFNIQHKIVKKNFQFKQFSDFMTKQKSTRQSLAFKN